MAIADLIARVKALTGVVLVRIETPALDLKSWAATEALLSELDESGEHLIRTVAQTPGSEGVVLTLHQDGRRSRCAFWGTPSGYELEGLVHAMERLAGIGPRPADDQAAALVKEIGRPLTADLYVAPT